MIYLLVCLLSFSASPGQIPDMQELQRLQNTLLAPAISDSLRKVNNKKFTAGLVQLLGQENAWALNLSSLEKISIITAPDKQFKLFTWFSVEDFKHKANGIILSKDKNNSRVFTLETNDINPKGNRWQSADKWPGALYYDISSFSTSKGKAYILLGFHPGDGTSQFKTIEILHFGPRGEPRFGLPVIVLENNRKVNRLVFQYSSKATMSLSFDRGRRKISFDHLSPPDISLKNQYQHYGPDFSVDALELRKGEWVYVSDIDARNRTENLGAEGQVLPLPSRVGPARRDTTGKKNER
jgi:hypothetical protein